MPVYATRQLLNFSDRISVRLVVSKCKCGSFSVFAKLANRFVFVALGSQITKLLCVVCLIPFCMTFGTLTSNEIRMLVIKLGFYSVVYKISAETRFW